MSSAEDQMVLGFVCKHPCEALPILGPEEASSVWSNEKARGRRDDDPNYAIRTWQSCRPCGPIVLVLVALIPSLTARAWPGLPLLPNGGAVEGTLWAGR